MAKSWLNSRIKILLVLSVSLLLLVPVWWRSTEVHRPVLPVDEIGNFISSAKKDGTIAVNVYFDPVSMTELPSDYLGADFLLQSRPLPEQFDPNDLDASLKSLTLTLSSEDRAGYFHLLVFCGTTAGKMVEITIGDRRMGWIRVNNATTIDKRVLKQTILAVAQALFSPPENNVLAAKFATSYRLSFTLAVAEPSYKGNSWDIASLPRFDAFTRALSRLARFAVEFQVQYVAPLAIKPKHNQSSGSFYLTKTQAMSFIDSNNWNLDFGVDTLTTLNFVLYIPERRHSPLCIDRGDSGYIVPQWGGLVLHNLAPLVDGEATENRGARELELDRVSGLFVTQVRSLFGMPIHKKYIERISSSLLDQGVSSNVRIISSPCGISEWEMDHVVIRRLSQVREKCFASLSQFISIITKMTTLPIRDEIATLLADTLESLQKSYSYSRQQLFDEAHRHAKIAFDNSETIFFDPTMIPMLYFPEEHKYAIYLPLFLPIIFPILNGFKAEFQRYRRMRDAAANEHPEIEGKGDDQPTRPSQSRVLTLADLH